MSETVGLIIAGLMLLTAALAAYATWQAPRSAAEIAERMRVASEKENERRRLKFHVFATLMQERAALSTMDGVRALNLIDIIFHDCRPVREAWADLFLSFDASRKIPPHVQDQRLRVLLAAMAAELGLGESLRLDDFGRVYYPNALAEEERVRQLERQAALIRCRVKSQAPILLLRSYPRFGRRSLVERLGR